LLGSCAALPTAGDVRVGITATPTDVGYPQFVPQDPEAGADPEAIVQGFLLAAQAGTSEDFVAARRYLTNRAAGAWVPLAAINLYSDSRPPYPIAPLEETADATAVEVRVPFDLVGTVDAEGRYVGAPPAATSQSFTVTREPEGMWRIAEAPAGILLSLGEFSNQFRAVTVYYVDAQGRTLVPDVRWYPRADTARNVVEAFVAGPPGWLAGVARDLVPPGTTATVDLGESEHGVPGTMIVTLSSPAETVAEPDRGRIVAALTASLTALAGITEVEVWCGGSQWRAPASDDPGVVQRTGVVRPYLVEAIEDQPDRLAELDGEDIEGVEGFEQGAFDSLTSLTVAADASAVAGLNERGHLLRVLRGEGATQQIAVDVGGVPPAFDANGRLWTGGRSTGPPGVASYPRLGAGTTIEVPWLAGETVLSVAPAPDAIRLLVGSRDDAGAVQLRLAAIERDSRGVPVALGRPIVIAALASAPLGVVWVDQLNLAILVPESDAVAPTPHLMTTGGLVSVLRAPTGGVGSLVAIAAGHDARDLLVVTESGGLFARIGARWEQRATSIRLAAYPV
jgi:hypothetical protein